MNSIQVSQHWLLYVTCLLPIILPSIEYQLVLVQVVFLLLDNKTIRVFGSLSKVVRDLKNSAGNWSDESARRFTKEV